MANRASTTKIGIASGSAVLAIVLAIVLIAVTSGASKQGPRATTAPTAAPAAGATTSTVPGDLAPALAKIAAVPASVLDTVGIGGQPASQYTGVNPVNVIKTPSSAQLAEVDGKPVFLFVGALFCPYCATERWSLLLALDRFGTFSGVVASASDPTDVYPNTQTFSFAGSTYTSPYISFSPVEVETVSRQPLEDPTAEQDTILGAWNPGVSIPFLYIGNRYTGGLPNWDNPQYLAGLTRIQIADDLSNPSSPVAREIDANANYLTAAICAVDGGRPASVCDSPGVVAATAQLKDLPAAAPIPAS
ncbi:MAG: DUF929 family protein [Acidimicrobiales bacterium]